VFGERWVLGQPLSATACHIQQPLGLSDLMWSERLAYQRTASWAPRRPHPITPSVRPIDPVGVNPRRGASARRGDTRDWSSDTCALMAGKRYLFTYVTFFLPYFELKYSLSFKFDQDFFPRQKLTWKQYLIKHVISSYENMYLIFNYVYKCGTQFFFF